MTVRKYSECKDIFWDEKSFNYSLEELCIWDIEKYWSLEYFLIKLCASLQGNEVTRYCTESSRQIYTILVIV